MLSGFWRIFTGVWVDVESQAKEILGCRPINIRWNGIMWEFCWVLDGPPWEYEDHQLPPHYEYSAQAVPSGVRQVKLSLPRYERTMHEVFETVIRVESERNRGKSA